MGRRVVYGLIILGLLATSWLGWSFAGERQSAVETLDRQSALLAIELQTAGLELALATDELDTTSEQVGRLNVQVIEFESSQTLTSVEVSSLNTQLAWARLGVLDLKAQLAGARVDVLDLEAQLAWARVDSLDLEAQLAWARVDVLELEGQLAATTLRGSQFASLSDLNAWLAADHTSEQTYIADTFDCDDFALMLQEHAWRDGYLLDVQALFYDDKDGWTLSYDQWTYYNLSGYSHYHALNLTIIDNTIYLIEPQTDEVCRLCLVD